MDQAGSITLQSRTQTSGAGSTYRTIGNVFTITASTLFVLSGYRISPALQTQVVLKNTGGSTTTVAELAVYASSS